MAFGEDVWPACQRGRRQSPVNIATEDLVFDHSLGQLTVEGGSEEVSACPANVFLKVALGFLQFEALSRGGMEIGGVFATTR